MWNGHVIELNVLQTGEACFSADWFTVPKKKKKNCLERKQKFSGLFQLTYNTN